MRVEGGKAARPSIYCWRRNEMGQSLYPLLFPPVRPRSLHHVGHLVPLKQHKQIVHFLRLFECVDSSPSCFYPPGREEEEEAPQPHSRWPHCVVILLLLLLDILLLALAIFAGLIFLGQLLFFPALYSAVDCGNPPSSFSPAHAYVNGCCRYNLFEWCLL